MAPDDSRTKAESSPVHDAGLPLWHSSLLSGIVLALLGGAAAGMLADQTSPVFAVDKKFHLPDLGPPPEKVAALEAEQTNVDRWNAMLELACFGGFVAGAVALGESWARRRPTPFLIAVPSGVVAGCMAGVVGSLAYQALDVRSVASVTETVKYQVVLLSVLGVGVGSALGLATGSPRPVVTCGLAAMAAGILIGFLFPVVFSFALPSANIAGMIPQGLVTRLLWSGITAASFAGLALRSLRTRKDAQRWPWGLSRY